MTDAVLDIRVIPRARRTELAGERSRRKRVAIAGMTAEQVRAILRR